MENQAIPSYEEWKAQNPGRNINDYFEAYPAALVNLQNQQPTPHPVYTPPPAPKKNSTQQWLINVLLVVAILGIAAFAYSHFTTGQQQQSALRNSDTPAAYAQGASANRRNTAQVDRTAKIKEREAQNPTEYFSIYNESAKIKLLKESIFRGTIQNTAEYTTYVDIVLQVSIYDRSGNIIRTQKRKIDARLTPGAYTDFNIRAKFPLAEGQHYKFSVLNAGVI